MQLQNPDGQWRLLARMTTLLTDMQGHYRRNWMSWITALMVLVTFQSAFKVGVNISDSLPQRAFLVTKFDRQLHRGDYVSFRWHGAGPYAQGMEFLKIVKGVPGDTVVFNGRDVFVNGEYLATAKEFSKQMQALDLGPSGVIPDGKFFVLGQHKDSLDSLYALTGWIDQGAVLGRAYPIF